MQPNPTKIRIVDFFHELVSPHAHLFPALGTFPMKELRRPVIPDLVHRRVLKGVFPTFLRIIKRCGGITSFGQFDRISLLGLGPQKSAIVPLKVGVPDFSKKPLPVHRHRLTGQGLLPIEAVTSRIVSDSRQMWSVEPVLHKVKGGKGLTFFGHRRGITL
jgi:hypothetical protein